MEAHRGASEASFPRGARSSDIPSYNGDYASPSRYHSSLSVYNQRTVFDTKPVSSGGYTDHLSKEKHGLGEGYTESLSRDGLKGGYSYSSSYDDMKSRHGSYSYTTPYEASKTYVYGKYEYGSEGGSESYKGRSYGGSSAPLHDSALSLHRHSSGPLMPGPHMDDGARFENKNQNSPYQQATNSSQSQYDHFGFFRSDLEKPDALSFKQSAAISPHSGILRHNLTVGAKDSTSMHYQQPSSSHNIPRDGLTSAASNYQTHYSQARLKSKYETTTSSGMYLNSDSTVNWRNAGGRVETARAGEEGGWRGAGSLLGIVQEPYALDRAGSSSRVSVYSQLQDGIKFGVWDGGAVRKVHLETGKKENFSNLSNSRPAVNGGNEGSMQAEVVDSARNGTQRKKRQSRWEPVEENEQSTQDGSGKKKKKSRWSSEKPAVNEVHLPDILKGLSGDDLELVPLRAQLIFINKKLQSGQVIDDRPEAERSPSPEPVYDNFGYRVNTREFRAREKLSKERQRILARLSEKSSSFKPPPDFKQSKFSRKMFIPIDKYPEYNFIGLIIGPRGHTQKKMEKESGARIFIRGKGSVRDGSAINTLLNDSENLHVLIEADSEDSLNKAAAMVEKLLVPVEDGRNEHKMAQLRELASLSGTLRSNDLCHVCKEPGHMAKDCPLSGSRAGTSPAVVPKGGTTQDAELCNGCKGHGHLSKDCPLIRPTAGPSLLRGGTGGHQMTDSSTCGADSCPNNDIDNTILYVAFLPLSVDDAHLLSLFSPFGNVVHAKVMRHLTTGISKSYGFVKFLDAADAAQAVALMNGYPLDGKVLQVKVKTNAECAN